MINHLKQIIYEYVKFLHDTTWQPKRNKTLVLSSYVHYIFTINYLITSYNSTSFKEFAAINKYIYKFINKTSDM